MSAAECARGHSTRSASSLGTTPPKRLNGPPGVGPLLALASGKHRRPDDRFIYLSDVLPTAWQGMKYAGVPTVAHCSSWASGRSATWPAGSPQQKWIDKIIRVDLVDERLERALARGVPVIDLREHEDDLPEVAGAD